ncbi:hypothetical protein SAVIM40S_07764 [Streptomyces avidinii]
MGGRNRRQLGRLPPRGARPRRRRPPLWSIVARWVRSPDSPTRRPRTRRRAAAAPPRPARTGRPPCTGRRSWTCWPTRTPPWVSRTSVSRGAPGAMSPEPRRDGAPARRRRTAGRAREHPPAGIRGPRHAGSAARPPFQALGGTLVSRSPWRPGGARSWSLRPHRARSRSRSRSGVRTWPRRTRGEASSAATWRMRACVLGRDDLPRRPGDGRPVSAAVLLLAGRRLVLLRSALRVGAGGQRVADSPCRPVGTTASSACFRASGSPL